MAEDLLALIEGFAEAMTGAASAQDLRGIRDKMDSSVFTENVRVALHRTNSPELRDALRRLQRAAEDLAASRENWREVFRIGGIGGGVGLFGGALIALSATPAVVIPAAGAIIIVWRATIHSRIASREISLLKQIADAARTLADTKGF